MFEKVIAALAGFIIAVISKAGYFGVLLLMAIESACIPLPSEIIMPFVLCSGLDRHEAGRALGQRPAIEAMVPPAGRGDYFAASWRDCVVCMVKMEGARASGGENWHITLTFS